MGCMGRREGGRSSVIAATVLRLLFCWAHKGPGQLCGAHVCLVDPRITQEVTESAQPSSAQDMHASSSSRVVSTVYRPWAERHSYCWAIHGQGIIGNP